MNKKKTCRLLPLRHIRLTMRKQNTCPKFKRICETSQISQKLTRYTTADTIYTEKFLNTSSCVMDELTTTDNTDPNYKQPYDWLKKVLKKNTKSTCYFRPLFVPHVYYSFMKTEPTSEMRKKILILA